MISIKDIQWEQSPVFTPTWQGEPVEDAKIHIKPYSDIEAWSEFRRLASQIKEGDTKDMCKALDMIINSIDILGRKSASELLGTPYEFILSIDQLPGFVLDSSNFFTKPSQGQSGTSASGSSGATKSRKVQSSRTEKPTNI